MGRIGWDATPARAHRSGRRQQSKLWKSRSVEKSTSRLFHRAWKSRKQRGIPTFQQLRRRLHEKTKPDISLATKTGHLHLLTTEEICTTFHFSADCASL